MGHLSHLHVRNKRIVYFIQTTIDSKPEGLLLFLWAPGGEELFTYDDDNKNARD